ncbi:MAG: hypothetical protein BIFFINMI_02030 [Phycisphaerae bacterium]|nr:hypothetical protein [Phycisphaerae bacterium]
MTSREPTLAAIRHEQPDLMPILLRTVAAFGPIQSQWLAHGRRIDHRLSLGIEDKVTMDISPQSHPDVTVREWSDDEGLRHRLACGQCRTPAGPVRMRCRCTQDCQYETGLSPLADENVSCGVELLVKGRDDLPRLAEISEDET